MNSKSGSADRRTVLHGLRGQSVRISDKPPMLCGTRKLAKRLGMRLSFFLAMGGLGVMWLAAHPTIAYAQSAPVGTAPSEILDQYRQWIPNWINAVSTAARWLFGALAGIELTWTAIVLLLEKSDLQSWTAALIRKMMWIGGFYMLLVFGPVWIPAIISSLEKIGQQAAHTGTLAPADVFGRGLAIAGNLLAGSSMAGMLTNFSGALALVLAALLTFLGFVVVTIQFVVAIVESYVTIGAGFIFLGFGGSRWTVPYVERYIGLAVAIGIKIMILYLLIGLGMTFSDGWLVLATQVPGLPNPGMSALDVMGASLIFTALCWQVPKFISGVIGGAPALSGGDVVSTGTTVGTAAYFTVASLASLFSAGGGAASSAGGTTSRGASAGGPTPPGGGGWSGSGGGSPFPAPPPSGAGSPPGRSAQSAPPRDSGASGAPSSVLPPGSHSTGGSKAENRSAPESNNIPAASQTGSPATGGEVGSTFIAGNATLTNGSSMLGSSGSALGRSPSDSASRFTLGPSGGRVKS